MEKKASLSLMILILVWISSFTAVSASDSKLYMKEGTKMVWKTMEHQLDGENGTIIGETIKYLLLEATDTASEKDAINCNYILSENQSIYQDSIIENENAWTTRFSTTTNQILDSEISSKFKTFFNEKDLDVQESLAMLSETEKYGINLALNLILIPELYGVLITLAFVSLGENVTIFENSTTLIGSGPRQLNGNMSLGFGIYEDENWDNLTIELQSQHIYSASANVLHNFRSEIYLKSIEWNETTEIYDTDESWVRHTLEIVYPTKLVDDLNAGSISGYNSVILGIAMLLSVPWAIIKKKLGSKFF